MTTTLTKTNNPSSHMGYLTGMDSLSFKMVSILFIVILNVTSLSSQTSATVGKSRPLIYPTFQYQKTKSVNVSVQPKVYTVLFAKNFPTLQGSTPQVLIAMDDSETFDYSKMFCEVTAKENTSSTKNEAIAKNL